MLCKALNINNDCNLGDYIGLHWCRSPQFSPIWPTLFVVSPICNFLQILICKIVNKVFSNVTWHTITKMYHHVREEIKFLWHFSQQNNLYQVQLLQSPSSFCLGCPKFLHCWSRMTNATLISYQLICSFYDWILSRFVVTYSNLHGLQFSQAKFD